MLQQLPKRAGFSLVEVMVGMSMLTAALLGLAAAASTGFVQVGRAREDSQYWADAQRVMDSLIMKGYNANTSSSTSVNGRPIKWVVTQTGATNTPNKIYVIVWRHGYQRTRGAADQYSWTRDTILLNLSSNTP